MHVEAEAEVTLTLGEAIPPSPTSSFGFIVEFEGEAFAASVVPAGSGHLVLDEPSVVQLRFNFPAATRGLVEGARFTFFEQGRRGEGRLRTHAV